LMACGAPLVAFDNPWGHWILRDGENCLLADRTVDGLTDRLERLCVDHGLRERLQRQGLKDIAERHGDWNDALGGIYSVLCDPEGATRRDDVASDGRSIEPATSTVGWGSA
jgi:glycosyltransferase involved in cell wall biosynthesis